MQKREKKKFTIRDLQTSHIILSEFINFYFPGFLIILKGTEINLLECAKIRLSIQCMKMQSSFRWIYIGSIMFSATTHTDLVTRCVEKDIPYQVIHNASIMNAVGCCGLQVSLFNRILCTNVWNSGGFFKILVAPTKSFCIEQGCRSSDINFYKKLYQRNCLSFSYVLKKTLARQNYIKQKKNFSSRLYIVDEWIVPVFSGTKCHLNVAKGVYLYQILKKLGRMVW